jgi:hypothetical protein
MLCVPFLLAVAEPVAEARHALDEAGPGRNTGAYVNEPLLGTAGALADEDNLAVTFSSAKRQYITVPVQAAEIGSFGSRLGAFSVELWYKSAAPNVGKALLGTLNDGETTFLQVERDRRGFNLAFRSEDGSMMRVYMSAAATATMSDGRFHHVVWVVASAAEARAAVYLDGQPDSATVAGRAPGGFAPFRYDFAIGATHDRGTIQQWIDATLDEIALYAQPVSRERVAAHASAAVAGNGSYAEEVMRDEPFAYWRLNESSRAGLRLLLDARVVESTDNAVLRVGRARKHPANPLFGQEHPWEVMFNNLYPNVLYDFEEKQYKVWHTLFVKDRAYATTPPRDRVPGTYMQRTGGRRDGLCYATSEDGIHWEKPMLNVHPWEGKPSNLLTEHVHGAGVLKEMRERDPARRYKMFFKGRVMSVRFSADGLRWGQYIACPEISAAGDTHNNALWAPELERYVGFTRLWNNQRRVVGRTESRDFIHWTPAVEVFRGEHLFDIYSMPVIRYGGVYIGLPAIFDEQADRVHTELAWSPDTVTWHRVDAGTPLIPNGEPRGVYDWGTVYASFPIVEEDGIRLYYGAGNGGHFDWREGFLCLAGLRPDGFAGYEPDDAERPAVVTTSPLRLGSRLRITADAQGGAVQVDVLGPAGEALLNGRPVTGDVTDRVVTWARGGTLLDELTGTQGRLRFTVRNAKLYSFVP